MSKMASILAIPALGAVFVSHCLRVHGQEIDRLHQAIDEAAARVMPKVIANRRDFHQNPELSNQEVRTAKIVADELRRLGLDVRTGVAHTGAVGLLRGGKPGRVVALRADMDALPVTEEGDLPFKSTTRTQYNGHEVGVMHPRGHDAHTAMLLGAAEVLAAMKAELPGTVVFLFQPAEEGLPDDEVCGAELMIKEGALDHPKVDAIFGVTPKGTDPGTVAPNHSPKFFVDENALITGVRALASLAVDFLAGTE